MEVSNVWNKSTNKDTNIIALTTVLNYQRMKFEEFQKYYNENGDNKIKPNGKKSYSNPGGNNSKLRVLKYRVKFKGNTTAVDRKKWDWCKHHKVERLFKGMYIHHPLNHAQWKKKRNK